MKKILLLLLVGIMLVSVISCGKKDELITHRYIETTEYTPRVPLTDEEKTKYYSEMLEKKELVIPTTCATVTMADESSEIGYIISKDYFKAKTGVDTFVELGSLNGYCYLFSYIKGEGDNADIEECHSTKLDSDKAREYIAEFTNALTLSVDKLTGIEYKSCEGEGENETDFVTLTFTDGEKVRTYDAYINFESKSVEKCVGKLDDFITGEGKDVIITYSNIKATFTVPNGLTVYEKEESWFKSVVGEMIDKIKSAV